MDTQCAYCETPAIVEDSLICLICKNNVHVMCLKRSTPGDLVGDIFFDFQCTKCTPDGKEGFVRKKLPWLLVIVLTLYNLSISSKGLSHCGYFHWKTHIASFITKHWSVLFPPNSKPKKKWIGTIAGTLSHNNPEYFVSGFDRIHESGWWKLTYNRTPKFYLNLYDSMSQRKQLLKIEKADRLQEKKTEEINVVDDVNSDDDFRRTSSRPIEHICSRTLPYMGRPPRVFASQTSSASPSQVNFSSEYDTESIHSNLTDFLANELSNSNLLEEITNLGNVENLATSNNLFLGEDDDNWTMNINDIGFDMNQATGSYLKTENNLMEYEVKDEMVVSNYQSDQTEDVYIPRIVQVTNFQEAEESYGDEALVVDAKRVKLEPKSDGEDGNSKQPQEHIFCEKSLFTVRKKRKNPWETFTEQNENEMNIEMMSIYDENILHNKLKAIIDGEMQNKLVIPSHIRRLYRKLSLRQTKRMLSKQLFNFDSSAKKDTSKYVSPDNILDRYYHLISNSSSKDESSSSLHARLAGSHQSDLFVSPYTGRVLHPFIYRNTKCIPAWVKLMCELQYSVNEELPERASVDFCYVRPQHIAAVNGLLQRMFWPGIDMSECLSYPDFSVIALYKKLVVGCAFLVPDVGHTEAYVSFMAVRPGWQKSGIASFMLYHLTQTCMSRDITLHVSSTNPAICLYQKFGFKIEEIVLDLYEKYLPIESKDSRHAFLLRMKR